MFLECIGGLQLMSWRPCWREANKTISLAAIVFGACFPQTWPPCPRLVNLKRLIENHQLHNTLLTKLFQWITVDFTSFSLWGFGGAVVRASSWIQFSLRTYVKRVGQRCAESRWFSPGAPVSSHGES
jgi:hypothetical protein